MVKYLNCTFNLGVILVFFHKFYVIKRTLLDSAKKGIRKIPTGYQITNSVFVKQCRLLK